jgi:Flp pilus assembly protein TadG
MRKLKRRGAVLIMFALSLAVIFGFLGLAIDVGRLYIARNEAQAFADAAALAGAVMLDGTAAGLTNATNAAAGTYLSGNTAWKRNFFQTRPFEAGDYTVMFSASGADGSFLASGAGAPLNSRFVEVIATANVPMSFSMVLLGGDRTSSPARARAVAAQVLKTTFDDGLIPFAPKGHCTTDATAIAAGYPACVASAANPEVFGVNMTKGQEYTIRWWGGTWSQSFDLNKRTIDPGIDPDLKPKKHYAWCKGDSIRNAPNTGVDFTGEVNDFPEQLYDMAEKKTLAGRGYFTSGQVNSASDYRMLVNGSMAGTIDLAFNFDGVEPQEVASISKALEDRGAGTKVYAPVVDPVTGKILSFYEFILVGTYGTNENWCAIYNGATVFGPGTTPVNQDGIYEIRLVR